MYTNDVVYFSKLDLTLWDKISMGIVKKLPISRFLQLSVHCAMPTERLPINLTPLVHETNAIRDIEKCQFLSAMARLGGVNFSPRESGGYRPKASHEICIEQGNLQTAIAQDFMFFENRFSGIIYGVGQIGGKVKSAFSRFSHD